MNNRSHEADRDDAVVARALKALPPMPPPPELAARLDALVARAAVAEPARIRRRIGPRLALAASLFVAVGAAVLLMTERMPPADKPTTTNAQRAGPPADDPVAALMARSAYLERVLAAVPRQGRVRRVGTASTITALEDRVALIDARLSRPGIGSDPEGRALLWRERVGLMNTLVALQTQPTTAVTL